VAGAWIAITFHHRDPSTKEFAVGGFSGALSRLLLEAQKCDLLCANCHRLRHVALEKPPTSAVVLHRRNRKARAVVHMGSICHGCGRDGPPALFEFHHRDANAKDFGLSEHGIPRRWEKTVAELAKCVMLCANCHREVHAGVRTLGAALAEVAVSYAA
jgi:predicted HNH restriction endonuclease